MQYSDNNVLLANTVSLSVVLNLLPRHFEVSAKSFSIFKKRKKAPMELNCCVFSKLVNDICLFLQI
eukprot:TRINITY_DN15203_c0_g1_i1.p2 TRINITY_DN15203_c0_g1~~TRINITY_DN15203_c0_g1_i1.p2  ORF type:complete len:66 (-),score=6.90 TRINITY_DN15203_c0_g1_i1:332-529(-)